VHGKSSLKLNFPGVILNKHKFIDNKLTNDVDEAGIADDPQEVSGLGEARPSTEFPWSHKEW
jgi:hypothetical protein